MVRDLEARQVVDLRADLAGVPDPLAVGYGLDGSVWVAANLTREDRREESGLGIFPKSRLEVPADLLLLGTRADERVRLLLTDELLPGGRPLCAPVRGRGVGATLYLEADRRIYAVEEW